MSAIFVFAAGEAARAHVVKEGDIFETMGPYVHQLHILKTRDATNAPPQLGIAVLGEGDVSERAGIEVGLLYSYKIYQRAFGNSLVAAKTHKLEIPLGYRYWLNERFSGAIAVSSSFSVGDPSVIYSSVGAADQSTQASAIAEYGAVASLQWELWTNNKFTFLADGRYFYSLTPNSNEDANEFQLIFGLKYLLQSKQKQ